MNRSYSYTPRGQARSPPRRDRLQSQDSSRASSFKNQAVMKQDLNIDEFGDMDSDEDDFQALGSSFVPPKPPAKPQYNLVPYGFLRDDDELVEEDYDGVPIDDAILQDSPKKEPSKRVTASHDSNDYKNQTWQNSPRNPQSEEIKGNPITVLGSSNRLNSELSKWPNDTVGQDRVAHNHPRLESSSLVNRMTTISNSNQPGRWDKVQKRDTASNISLGNNRNILSLMQMDCNVVKAQNLFQAQIDSNPFIQSGNRQSSSMSFVPGTGGTSSNTTSSVRGSDDSHPFLARSNKSTTSGGTKTFVRGTDDSNPFIKMGNKPAQSSTQLQADKGRESSQNLKGQVLQPGRNQMFTPTHVAGTSQLEMLQAAALQQALTGLTQLSSQSGLGLLGAQKLLAQASQNSTLAAALVGTRSMINTALGSVQPNNTSNSSTIEALLKSAGNTATPDTVHSNLGLLTTYPLRSNMIGNCRSTPLKKPIPNGSGATRYPAPDLGSLVFDPSTGYRFDASTGLHYDANSGYFFNSELKVFLRWDKFTQTYLKVDNPPGVPRFNSSSTDRISYMKESSLGSQDLGQQSSSLSNSSYPKERIHSSTFSTGNSLFGLPQSMNVSTSGFQKEGSTVHSTISTIPIDFSKPPPPLPHTSSSGAIIQPVRLNPPSSADQKAAALPNFAETSLFNKLRKAKLAQTAHTKADRKWGSPDPLLEAAQKHASETNRPQEDVLNLNEILERSRQFMKQNTGNENKLIGRQLQRNESKSWSRDRKKIRSRSRSVGRPSRRSSQQRRPLARSPDPLVRVNSRGRSPNNRGRRRPSLSPARKRKSVSRGRSPINRARGRNSLSPEERKRRPTSKGKSPLRKRGKSSKSPAPRQRRSISKGRSSERRPRGRLSISPELRKRIRQSRTPNRSQSPKVKVVLDQSPGGSKIRVPSPSQNNKRSADRGLSAESMKLKRKLRSPETIRALSPGRRNQKNSVEDKTGLSSRKPVKGRLGMSENKREEQDLKHNRITELKSIPYDKSRNSSKNSSGTGKEVSGYKSLSNLRNQSKDQPREKETQKKTHVKDKSVSSAEVDLTVCSDDDKHSRANHRLVSERTFLGGWKRQKPNPPTQLSLTKECHKTKPESSLTAKGPKDCTEEANMTKKNDTGDKNQIEESSEFDFLNDTLDDDNESTVIDEYEEILDYQDLEGTTELLEEESASSHTKPDIQDVKKSSSKGSASPAIDLCGDSKDHSIKVATSAESNLESIQCSSVGDSELVETGSVKVDSLGDGAVVAQSGEDGDTLKDEEVEDEHIEGIELCDLEDLEVVSEFVSESGEVPEPQRQKEMSSGTEEMRILEERGSCKFDDALTVQDETPEVKAEITRNKVPNAVAEAMTVIKDAPDNKTIESESGKHAPDESLKDRKEVTIEETILSKVNDSSIDEKQHYVVKHDLVETEEQPSSEHLNLQSQTMKDITSDIALNSAAAKRKENARDEEPDTKVSKGNGNNDESDTQADTKNVKSDDPDLQNSTDTGKGINSQTEAEKLLVRSVSDIEKFLLLSSQEVEAKQERGIEPTAGKTDKKSGVFSRLGEKLSSDEAGCEPAVVLELLTETSVSAPGPSNKISAPGPSNKGSASPSKPQQPATKGKPAKASNELNKPKKANPQDPVGMLFDDKPSVHILIGPMNFIEPLQNFQHFTQIYMQRLLQQEKVQYKKVYVHHEDSTGAPYHYIIITFHCLKDASNWFNKRKGRFKGDQKLFKRVAGHLKQKFIPSAETFLHFTKKGNWLCRVCRKGNFPPRSLCFNCFQHKDPEGFSPLTVLDKGLPPYKPSNFVGTPKLKFLVTKEKVIECAPPLDGFDIKNMVMIMDEEMRLPAGICVFEMPNIIDAGKLKKYLNHRDVEAVSVEMHEKPKLELCMTDPVKTPSRMTLPIGSRDERLPKPVMDLPGPGIGTCEHTFEDRAGHMGYPEGRGIRERPPRSPSREVLRVPRDRLPSPIRDTRVPRGRSPTPTRDARLPRGRSPAPSGSVTRDRSPSPTRDAWLPRGRSPVSSRSVTRGRSPSPTRDARLPRGRSPIPSLNITRGRSPSPLRRRVSIDRVRSRSPRLHSPGYQPRSRSPRHVSPFYEEKRYLSPEVRSAKELPPRGRIIREVSPRYDTRNEPHRYRSRERVSGYRSPVPVPYRSPGGYQSPPRYRSRSPVYDTPRRRSPSPRYRSPSPVRPTKPDGRGDWSYPPPDPTVFRFEPKSGLDYDPTTTLYYEPKSCCFYNDDTNQWLEYDPRTGRYILVR